MEMKVIDVAGITVGLGHAGFSLTGGAASTFATANAFPFAVNGKTASLAAAAGQATPTTDINTGVAPVGLTLAQKLNGTVLVFLVNAAGTVAMAQGSVELTDAAGNFVNPPKWPSIPDNYVPFGYVVVKAGSTLAAPFVPGTGNWNQTGITTAAVSIAALPDRNQVA